MTTFKPAEIDAQQKRFSSAFNAVLNSGRSERSEFKLQDAFL